MLFRIVALLMSKYLCTFSASVVVFLFVSMLFMVYQYPEIFNTQKRTTLIPRRWVGHLTPSLLAYAVDLSKDSQAVVVARFIGLQEAQ